MGFVDFLITKLVGYDILKSEKELKVSLGNAQRQISSLSQQKEILQESVEGKQGRCRICCGSGCGSISNHLRER